MPHSTVSQTCSNKYTVLKLLCHQKTFKKLEPLFSHYIRPRLTGLWGQLQLLPLRSILIWLYMLTILATKNYFGQMMLSWLPQTFCWPGLKNTLSYTRSNCEHKKNPKYSRHWISWHMRILAMLQYIFWLQLIPQVVTDLWKQVAREVN